MKKHKFHFLQITKFLKDIINDLEIDTGNMEGYIYPETYYFFEGQSKNETYDMNDHLTVFLPKGKAFTIKTRNDSQIIEIENECIISLAVK